MRVLFVTSECVPFFKLGGLADVSYSLPVSLSKIGVDVSIIMPYYDKIHLTDVTCVGQLAVDFDRKRELVFVFHTKIPGYNVPVYLIRHPILRQYDGKDIAPNFAFFSKVVATLYLFSSPILGETFDILHCNDWHTALVPAYLGENDKVRLGKETLQAKDTKTIISIHNLLYQGETGVSIARKTGLPKTVFHPFKTPLGNAVRLLGEGIGYADVVSTVSPTYAREIESSNTWKKTNVFFKGRHDHIVGILNGIDETIWDPEHDTALPVKYSIKTVTQGKLQIKKSLQNALRLPQVDVPLFGFVGRLEPRQKGIDILRQAVARIKRRDFQMVILGNGTKVEIRKLERLVRDNENIAFIPTFDERLARRIYAGSDVMLVPSKFEPCGLTQMIAMRYGSIPLVRRTGGLADSVIDNKTGFVFEQYTGSSLRRRMEEAIEFWYEKKSVWNTWVHRVMKQDFTWTKSAKRYKKLYKDMLPS
jgi:starch synthase